MGEGRTDDPRSRPLVFFITTFCDIVTFRPPPPFDPHHVPEAGDCDNPLSATR